MTTDRRSYKLGIASLFCALISYCTQAAPPPIAAFARLPAVENVVISPNGKKLALITGQLGHEVLMTVSLDDPNAELRAIAASDAKASSILWCQWVKDNRLFFAVGGSGSSLGKTYKASYLMGIDADGSNRQLLYNGGTIFNLLPEDAKHVLLARGSSVFLVSIDSGAARLVDNGAPNSQYVVGDAQGHARLAWGTKQDDDHVYYYGKAQDSGWRPLFKVKMFDSTQELLPFAVENGTAALAEGSYNGRDALWRIDLADNREPKLIFENSAVDIGTVLVGQDHKLLGVRYDDGKPAIHYFDEAEAALMDIVNAKLPQTFNRVVSSTLDRSKLIILASSDVEAGTYYVFDRATQDLKVVARSYPDLDISALGKVRPIKYRASDGTIIPGYFTVPPNTTPKKLPLIVMPHGGPIARDYWSYDFLSQFLASRGYGVLKMNFRGSDGYGWKWFHDAHQDWGGLTYSDIIDGVRWAVEQGIADPDRICIVGWSFGGYASLLGATRNGDMFRCAVSIAGLSDLVELRKDAQYYRDRLIRTEQIGTDTEKLRADSPRLHAENVQIPLLMVHGDLDVQVDISHSKMMDSALNRYKKPHRLVVIDGADHQMSRESDRITLLTEIEKFLSENIGEKKK